MDYRKPDATKLSVLHCTHFRRGEPAMFAAIGWLAGIAGCSVFTAMGGHAWQWIYDPSFDEVFNMLCNMRTLGNPSDYERQQALDRFGAMLEARVLAKPHLL